MEVRSHGHVKFDAEEFECAWIPIATVRWRWVNDRIDRLGEEFDFPQEIATCEVHYASVENTNDNDEANQSTIDSRHLLLFRQAQFAPVWLEQRENCITQHIFLKLNSSLIV